MPITRTREKNGTPTHANKEHDMRMQNQSTTAGHYRPRSRLCLHVTSDLAAANFLKLEVAVSRHGNLAGRIIIAFHFYLYFLALLLGPTMPCCEFCVSVE